MEKDKKIIGLHTLPNLYQYNFLQKIIKNSFIYKDNGKRMYKFIGRNADKKNSLCANHSHDVLSNKFIVSLALNQGFDCEKDPTTINRLFCVFENSESFFDYMEKYNFNARSFYEVIMGDRYQKPHFDIDIDKKVFTDLYGNDNFEEEIQSILDCIIRSCIHVLESKKIVISVEKNILIYTRNILVYVIYG